MAKKEVLYTMLLGKKLLERMRLCSRIIYDVTTAKAFEVFPGDKEWRANRTMSVPFYYSLNDNCDKCIDLVQQVYSNANVDVRDLLERAKEQSEIMVMRAQKFCMGNAFLGLKLASLKSHQQRVLAIEDNMNEGQPGIIKEKKENEASDEEEDEKGEEEEEEEIEEKDPPDQKKKGSKWWWDKDNDDDDEKEVKGEKK